MLIFSLGSDPPPETDKLSPGSGIPNLTLNGKCHPKLAARNPLHFYFQQMVISDIYGTILSDLVIDIKALISSLI